MKTGAEIRKSLIDNLQTFKKLNLHYGYEEQQAILNLLSCINPVIEEYEDYNLKHPNHGQKESAQPK